MESIDSIPSFTMPATMRARITSIPKLHSFIMTADQVLGTNPDAIDLCRESFRELCTVEFLRELVNHELNECVRASLYFPESATQDQMLVAKTDHLTIVLKLLNGAQRGRLVSLAEDQLVGAVGRGSIRVALFEQTRPELNEVLDRRYGLVSTGGCELHGGELLVVRAARNIVDMVSVEGNVFLLLLATRVKARLRWEYDRQTLLPVKAIASDLSASRLEFAASMVAELGDRGALPLLGDIFRHHDHFVRWSALNAIFQLDPGVGVDYLKRALMDPHPHVRNAARKSLIELGEELPEPAEIKN